MNRAQRRKYGVTVRTAPTLTVTPEQMAQTFQGYSEGDLIVIAGRAWKDGAVQKCEPGEETPFCLKVVERAQPASGDVTPAAGVPVSFPGMSPRFSKGH